MFDLLIVSCRSHPFFLIFLSSRLSVLYYEYLFWSIFQLSNFSTMSNNFIKTIHWALNFILYFEFCKLVSFHIVFSFHQDVSIFTFFNTLTIVIDYFSIWNPLCLFLFSPATAISFYVVLFFFSSPHIPMKLSKYQE